MTDSERFKLLGTYKSPRIKMGTIIDCEYRDAEMVVHGYSDALIPWPTGHRRNGGGRGLVVFGDLAEAVRCESNQAVCHWFGMCPATVWQWRKALGVELSNEGTHRLRSDYTKEPWSRKAWKKAQSKAGDPARRQKISEARKGKPRPAHVIEAMTRGRLAKGVSQETRRKMSEAHKARGTYPPAAGKPWTIEEDEVVRTLPGVEAAKRTGRSLASVYERRMTLKLPDGRRRATPD